MHLLEITAYVFSLGFALWDCVPRVCGGEGGWAGGGVPLGAVPVLSWGGEVSLGGKQSSSTISRAYLRVNPTKGASEDAF